MLALDILTQSEPRKIKWWRNWEATFDTIGDLKLTALMHVGDLYSYRTHGWHQFGWPILPMEWYS